MLKRALTVALFGATLLVWPSCGGDPEEAEKAKVFQYLRGELNGTWKGTTPSREVVTLTFALANDPAKVLVNKCTSRGGLVQAAFACVTTYDLPVTAKIDSNDGTYRGDLSGKATALGVASGVNLNLTGATTLYGEAKGPNMTGSLGTSSVITIALEKN
ncbi:MAG: hypothetical protein QM765_26820 [Myxococcales bacterium]